MQLLEFIAAALLSHVVHARMCVHLGVAQACPSTSVVWQRPHPKISVGKETIAL